MPLIKTSELTGPALDWAVAKCEGWEDWDWENEGFFTHKEKSHVLWLHQCWYSSNWAQGGPIIEREEIGFWNSGDKAYRGHWAAANAAWMEVDVDSPEFDALPDPMHGPTPLIAAMRCYVALKLGDEVEAPDELTT